VTNPSVNGFTPMTNAHAMTSHNSTPTCPKTMNEPPAYAGPQGTA